MRYKLRKGQQLRPHGGHHYKTNGIKFEGETMEEVRKKISDYRISNMIPVGYPEREILEYYADKFPWMVDPIDVPEYVPKNFYYSQWRDWIHGLWKSPRTRFLTPTEAQLRWSVCLNCKHNIKLSVDGTQEGVETLRRAFLLRRGQNTSPKLGFCSLHLHDNSAASFLEAPIELSGKKKDSVNPPDCWCV